MESTLSFRRVRSSCPLRVCASNRPLANRLPQGPCGCSRLLAASALQCCPGPTMSPPTSCCGRCDRPIALTVEVMVPAASRELAN
eukprot:7078971-Heterocapsa_arctica.AAC.1